MTAETESLMLEPLRGMRAVVASVGSVATDLKDRDTRTAALEPSEGARA